MYNMIDLAHFQKLLGPLDVNTSTDVRRPSVLKYKNYVLFNIIVQLYTGSEAARGFLMKLCTSKNNITIYVL